MIWFVNYYQIFSPIWRIAVCIILVSIGIILVSVFDVTNFHLNNYLHDGMHYPRGYKFTFILYQIIIIEKER